jgi:hypothetical protein
MPERVEVTSANWTPGLTAEKARLLLFLLFQTPGDAPSGSTPDCGHALGDPGDARLVQATERGNSGRAGGGS